MEKKYCVLDKNIFVRICTEHEYHQLKNSTQIVYDFPPEIIPAKTIAVRENDTWVIKRLTHAQKLLSKEKRKFREELKEKVKLKHIKEKIEKKYEEIPPFIENNFVPNYLVTAKLKKEQTLLNNKLISLYENKKRILKKLKIYKKDLDNKIIELSQNPNNKTKVPLGANNEISIIDIIPSKVPF